VPGFAGQGPETAAAPFGKRHDPGTASIRWTESTVSRIAESALDGKLQTSVGGIARRGQSGRTTRTTLPLVDGSENAASVGGTVGDLTIRGLMTAWDGHGLVFLSVKRSGQVFDSCRFRPCGAGIF
jgi:hypothetical protein